MRKIIFLVLILSLGLILRISASFEMKNLPVFSHPQLDEMEYDNWAKDIARGNLLWDYIPIHSPAYAFFLSLGHRLTKNPYLFPRLLQALIDCGNVLLIFFLARRIFGRGPALMSALLTSFYFPMVYFSARLLPATINLFLILLGLLLGLMTQKFRRSLSFFSGLSIGLSGIFWPLSLAIAPALLLWFLVKDGIKKSAGVSVIFLLGLILPIVPISYQNYLVGKDFILLQDNFGMNFYLGNNPNSNGTPYLRPSGEWDRIQSMPVIEAGIENPSLQNRFYFQKWSQWARAKPFFWLNLLVKKSKLLFDNREVIASFDPSFYQQRMIPLRVAIINSAIVIGLGLAGLFLGKARSKELNLIFFSLGFLGLALIFTLISSRYRLGFMALLLVCSGAGLWEIFSSLKSKTYSDFFKILTFAGIVYGLSIIPLPRISDQSGYEYVHFGSAYLEAGDLKNAETNFLQATNTVSARASGFLGLARVNLAKGDLESAQTFAELSLPLDSGFAFAYLVMGEIFGRQGELAQAILSYQTAVQLRPEFATAYLPLADALIKARRIPEAKSAIGKLKLLRPDLPEILVLDAKIKSLEGRNERAIELLKTYLKLKPEDKIIEEIIKELEAK